MVIFAFLLVMIAGGVCMALCEAFDSKNFTKCDTCQNAYEGGQYSICDDCKDGSCYIEKENEHDGE